MPNCMSRVYYNIIHVTVYESIMIIIIKNTEKKVTEKKPYGTRLTDAVPTRCNNNNYFQSCPTNTRTHVIGLLYIWSLLLLLSLLFTVRTKDARVRVRVLCVCTPSPISLVCVFFKRNFLYVFTVRPGRKHGHYVCVCVLLTLFFYSILFRRLVIFSNQRFTSAKTEFFLNVPLALLVETNEQN